MPDCISLSGSTVCPAWSSASISTDPSQFGSFPFLQNVTNLKQFDQSLSAYATGEFATLKYVDLLGCTHLNASATDDYYARYTTSVICSGLVQSSKADCQLTAEQSPPLCASTCAQQATGEEEIMVNDKLCPKTTNKDYMSLIHADFVVCSNPARSITGGCILGSQNEPDNCGFASNLIGLCAYCGSSSVNSTDSCCANADAPRRCNGVTLPTSTATVQPIGPTSTSTPAAGVGAGAGATGNGLSGGQIAGIVIGSVVGAAVLVALAVLLCMCQRQRRKSDGGSLNQPNPQRRGSPPMHQPDSPRAYNMIPGGRVARMSALRELPSSSPAYSRTSGAVFGGAKYSDSSDSEAMGASPGAISKRRPPVTGKRQGSLSSSSAMVGLDSDYSSPRSGNGNHYSSPEAVTSGQSEQLSYFRDYYSQDDIYPGDKVAVLWAYSPRAGDEFELDRGEMLKVIGIWDDGWATGVRLPERAEDYDIRHREQRDSGVSNGSRPGASPAPSGEIKAFPLVCICLPQHWRKIIDGGSPEENDDET